MKKTAITIAALVAAALFMSCSDGGSSGSNDSSENQNPSAGEKTYVTAKFDLNLPDNTNLEYGYSNNEQISDITKETGTSITLPGTECYYSKWSGETFICNYKFSGWNTESDGSGISYNAGDSFTLNEDITFYAQYKASLSDDSDNDDSESGDFLDIATTAEYKMKVGETIKLKSSWNEECYYSIYENEYDAISLNNDIITAETIGTATVKMTSSTNSSKAGYCIITVTSDSFRGTGLDYKMIGKWKDGKNSLVLNSDKTGSLIVYTGDNLMADATFSWKTFSEGSGSNKRNYFKIYDSNDTIAKNDYLEKDYTITSVSSSTLKIKGYLVVFGNLETTWTKEN
ncbi:InlB B-repeat-containing protein [uncultured Treponema sp.]|uniref:InlB B-repeat-containing protein n=1 Tax=uncultured Treponema sp. TaxID=162155 RepID=UPI0025D27B09|nr:InlB B-repeat-containing protein [uncultured Treponema sp.]